MKQRIVLLFLIAVVIIVKVDAQVNLQSGAAQSSIPMYSYTDPGNRISTGITLIYTSGNGLKVNEVPSVVGAGWDLQAGGFIQRIQRGEPDDQKNSDTYTYPTDITTTQQDIDFRNWCLTYYPNGYLYSEFSPNQAITNGAAYTPYGVGANALYRPAQKYQADLEQDMFLFNFNGKVGYFVIGKKDQNNQYPIRTLYDSKLRITKIDGDLNNTNNIRTTISGFEITDEDGIKYVFKDAEISQVCVYDKIENYTPLGAPTSVSGFAGIYYIGSGTPPNSHLVVTKGNLKNAFVKNKWYLSEIINPYTGVKIVFEYESFAMDRDGTKTGQMTSANGRTDFTLTIDRIVGTSKRLKKIKSSAVEEVEFIYAGSQRIDDPSSKYLQSISIKYNSQEKYRWDFECGYFVKNEIKPANYNFTAEDRAWARLCLKNVRKVSSYNTSEPPFVFEYYLESQDGYYSVVPPLFCVNHDVWGYYNPKRYGFYNPSNDTYSISNPPYEPVAGTLLPKLYYTGLTVDFATYGLHYYSPSIEARNGILKSVSNPYGGRLIFEYEQHYWSTSGDNYTGYGGVRVKRTSNLWENETLVNEYKYVMADGVTTSAWGSDIQAFKRQVNLKLHKKCSNQKFPALNYKQIGMSLAGALFNSLSGVPLSPATLPILATNIAISVLVDLFTPDWEEYVSDEKTAATYSAHNILPFQYSRVEVVNKISTDNIGKTVYEFTTPFETDATYAIDYSNMSPLFSSKQRYAYWLYGQEKTVTVFDKNNKKVKRIENEYTPIKYELIDDKFKSRAWIPTKKTYDCPFSPTNGSGSTDILQETYQPICGRIQLSQKREFIYNDAEESTSMLTEYFYSSANYKPVKIKNTNSKGEMMEAVTHYADEYDIPGVLQTMKSEVANLGGIPVSTQSTITKSGQTYLLSGTVTEFGLTPSGDIRPVKTYSARSVDPVLSSTAPFSVSQLIPGTNLYEKIEEISYSIDGLPVQVENDQGKTSTIYDYNKKLPVATTVNANITDIAYTSFEADGNGGWTFDPLKISEESSPTGKRSLKATSEGTGAVISRTISNTRRYILSFWKKGQNPVLSGASYYLRRSYENTTTGYTYYEYEVSNGTSISITNRTGASAPYTYYTFNLDEIRLYPIEARMSTITYDPVWGKIAEADENGRIIYYEYDPVGRLKLVRDQDRNVIKAYEYNYKQ